MMCLTARKGCKHAGFPLLPRTRALAAVVALLALGACAHAGVPSRDRMHVRMRYEKEPRELAVSMWVTPFFRDGTRRLLSVEAPDERGLLVTPRGEEISPGPVQAVLPAGTRVVVRDVSFPTGWTSFWRPLFTPKDRVWIELAVEGRPDKPSYVLVLREDLKNEDDVFAEVERLVTKDPVARELSGLTDTDRLVVRTKVPAPGASMRALELALPRPNLRRIHGEGPSVSEEWTWQGDAGLLLVRLKDGVVVAVEKPAAQAPQPAARETSRLLQK